MNCYTKRCPLPPPIALMHGTGMDNKFLILCELTLYRNLATSTQC